MNSDVKKNVLGVGVSCVDYEKALNEVIESALHRRGFTLSALAVHGVMTGVLDARHRYRLNSLDMVVPDGQPVRWALNWLHKANLDDRVYGPELMLRICAAAEENALSVFLFGSSEDVLKDLRHQLVARFPGLKIAGSRPSRYRTLSVEEIDELVAEIYKSGASIVFVGLGCPRQEVWIYEYRDLLQMPLIAVGAAFDFHAGLLKQAPAWMQRFGLEWLFRLMMEPLRLWRRYVLLNPSYLLLVLFQKLRVFRPDPKGRKPLQDMRYG